MTDSHNGHLVKMINEIARNLAASGDEEQAAQRTADHLQRFWTRDMQQQLQTYVDGGGGGLVPIALRALGNLEAQAAGS